MGGLAKVVSYELYTLEPSGWVLHGRYPSAERDDAIAEAKAIEKHQERATRLVRETYYPENGQADEAVVRISPNLSDYKRKLARPVSGGGIRRGGGGDIPDFGLSWDNGKPGDRLPTGQLVSRILMMVLSALIIAGGVTVVVSLLLRSSFLIAHVSASTRPQILFGTFLVVFLLSALPLVNRYIPTWNRPEQEPGAASDTSFLDMSGRAVTEPQATPQTNDKPALFQNDAGLIVQPQSPEPEPQEPAKPEAKKAPEKKPEPEAKKEPEAKTAPEPEPEETEEEPIPAEIAALERHRMTMMRFLTGTLTVLKDSCPHLDAYNKFGLNLIMAGVCAALGRREALSEAQVTTITCEAISMLGSKPALAESFCRNLETHVMDPRYGAMFQQGGQSLEEYLDGTGAPFEAINAAMSAWNRPADRISGSNIVTIMFTDMVGSTQLTQRRGDTAAQDYVRAHNAIVRAALAQHQGVEIKHTGDGIMASFGAPSFAVDAAIAIQKATRRHNAGNPQQEFHLRVGINAGEPIIEDDDMFGVAVQMAARVCSEAAPDHILIANVVRELLAGKPYPVRTLEPRHLRGIKEAQTLHDVLWTEIADAAPAPATEAAAPAAPPPAAPASGA